MGETANGKGMRALAWIFQGLKQYIKLSLGHPQPLVFSLLAGDTMLGILS